MDDQLNKFYEELTKIMSAISISDMLDWMALHSQSVVLNYGEDNQMWECSWITGGDKRFTGVEEKPIDAIRAALNSLRNDILFPDELSEEYRRRVEGSW